MACDLHPIICIRDAVTICIPVTVSFHLGCGYAKKEKKQKTENNSDMEQRMPDNENHNSTH